MKHWRATRIWCWLLSLREATATCSRWWTSKRISDCLWIGRSQLDVVVYCCILVFLLMERTAQYIAHQYCNLSHFTGMVYTRVAQRPWFHVTSMRFRRRLLVLRYWTPAGHYFLWSLYHCEGWFLHIVLSLLVFLLIHSRKSVRVDSSSSLLCMAHRLIVRSCLQRWRRLVGLWNMPLEYFKQTEK